MIIALLVTFIFLILRFTVTLFNFLSNPKLPRIGKHYQHKVSILIPARNEQDDILNLLKQRPDIAQLNNHYAGVNWYRNHLDELKTVDSSQTRTL